MGNVAVYDLAKAPASWDFLQFLINAKLKFGEFNVAFKEGPVEGFRADGVKRSVPQRRAIFENVMRPALKLVGAEEVDEPGESLGYFQIDAVHAVHRGRSIPKWEIPAGILEECKAWLGNRRPLVITLREADYYPERNSNLEAWLAFAATVEDVIFVRDTAKADEPLPFETCPRASRDFLFRAALMSLARCNFLVGNGPALIAEYIDAPWLMFNPVRPDLDYAPTTELWWMRKVGIAPGEQFPWSNENQRIVWEHDTLEAIQEAWDSIKGIHLVPQINSISALGDDVRNEHVRRNCAAVSARVEDGIPAHDRTASIVCFGPSLKTSWPALLGKSDIYCVGAAHSFLIKKGIVPDACIDCDPRHRVAEQLGEPCPSVKYWLASCIHPAYVEKLAGYDVSLFHLHNGEVSAEYVWSIEPEAWLLVGGGSVGLRSISLLYARGYRSFEIHGMDSSYADDEEYAGAHTGPPKKGIINVRCRDRWFKTNLSLVDYARQFFDDRRLWADATFRLHGDGLLQEMSRC